MRTQRLTLAAVGLAAALAATAAGQTTWLVSNNPAEFPDFADPRDALASPLVVDGDIIEVSAGEGPYTMSHAAPIDFDGKAVTLRARAGQRVQLRASGAWLAYAGVLSFSSGEGPDSIVEGFEISAGAFTYACVGASGSAPTIRNCDFVNAHADFGSAIIVSNGAAPVFENCTIRDSQATWRSFPLIRGSGSLTMLGCTISDATSEYSLLDFVGDLTLIDCVFEDSLITHLSGGPAPATFIHSGGILTIDRCQFADFLVTTGGLGASMQLHGSSSITNSVFERHGYASLIDAGGGLCELINCTIAASTSTTIAVSSAPSSLHVINSIVWPVPTTQPPFPQGVVVQHSNIQTGWPGVGNINADPRFAPDGSLALGLGSPCIDAGDNAAVPPGLALDFLGKPRFRDDAATPDTGSGPAPIVDMGATEFFQCRPDLIPDGIVNNNDFFFYLTLFAAASPGADFTHTAIPGSQGFGLPNGVLNNDDFFTFLYLFAAGC